MAILKTEMLEDSKMWLDPILWLIMAILENFGTMCSKFHTFPLFGSKWTHKNGKSSELEKSWNFLSHFFLLLQENFDNFSPEVKNIC